MMMEDYQTVRTLFEDIKDLEYRIKTLESKEYYANDEDLRLNLDTIANLKKVHHNKKIILSVIFNDKFDNLHLAY